MKNYYKTPKILKFIVFTSLIYNSAFSLKVDAGFLDKQGRIANIEVCKAQQYNRPINKDVSKKLWISIAYVT